MGCSPAWLVFKAKQKKDRHFWGDVWKTLYVSLVPDLWTSTFCLTLCGIFRIGPTNVEQTCSYEGLLQPVAPCARVAMACREMVPRGNSFSRYLPGAIRGRKGMFNFWDKQIPRNGSLFFYISDSSLAARTSGTRECSGTLRARRRTGSLRPRNDALGPSPLDHGSHIGYPFGYP